MVSKTFCVFCEKLLLENNVIKQQQFAAVEVQTVGQADVQLL